MTEAVQAALDRARMHTVRGIWMLHACDFLCLGSEGFVAFDLETTGLRPEEDAILEIGAVRVQYGSITERFSSLVNPERRIPGNIRSLTGITDDMVRDAPTIRPVLEKFLAFAGDMPCAAHNAGFDASFLRVSCRAFGLRMPCLMADSLEMARRFWPEETDHTLGNMANAIGYDLKDAHRALGDAEAVAALVNAAILKERKRIPANRFYVPGMELPRKMRTGLDQPGHLAVARAVLYLERAFGEKGPFSREELTAIPCRPVAQFPGITNLYELAAVLRDAYCRESARPEVQRFWREDDPAEGQDDVTARLVTDLCGLPAAELAFRDSVRICNQKGQRIVDLTGLPHSKKKKIIQPAAPCSTPEAYERYRVLQRRIMAVLRE